MSCYAAGGSLGDAAVSENIRRATLEMKQREKLEEMQEALDAFHTRPTIDTQHLEELSIVCGAPLDMDSWSCPAPNTYQLRFFMPLD